MAKQYRPPKIKKYRIKSGGFNPKHFSKNQLKIYAYLVPLCILMALPIVFNFMNAFKPTEELFAYPPRFFVNRPTFDNFIRLFSLSADTNIPASRYLFNSVISTAVVVLASLYMSAAAGFALSKKRFIGKRTMFEINSLALMFVPIAVAIPRYFVIFYSGLQNSFWANVIPLLAMPVGLFLVKQFIDQLPDALVEAAYIDGAKDFRILFQIIIPLIRPALATVAILAFQSSWNNTEASTLFIHDETKKTFAFYLSTLTSTSGAGNDVAGAGISAAATLIMFVPNLILFIFMQSKVMNTMMNSGIK